MSYSQRGISEQALIGMVRYPTVEVNGFLIDVEVESLRSTAFHGFNKGILEGCFFFFLLISPLISVNLQTSLESSLVKSLRV